MKIIILGSGQVGSTIAHELASMPNHDVTIIAVSYTHLRAHET
ncbi:2-dehydropantoate 2-reductase N-terminal domain-containing protein, partial [Kingella kingae]